MELNEMQVIWDSQKEETMYAFDTKSMHDMVQKKAKRVARDMSLNEFGMIAITLFTALMQAREPLLQNNDMHKLFGSVIMLCIGFWMFMQRKQRLRRRNSFAPTMLGDLDRAISEADDHLRMASNFQWWFLFPAMLISLVDLSMREEPQSIPVLIGISFAYVLAMVVVRLSIRFSSLPVKQKLESLRDTLTHESR